MYTYNSMKNESCKTNLLLFSLIALFGLLLFSCATAPPQEVEEPDQPAQRSTVTVYSAMSGELFADGELVGSIEEGASSTIKLPPGAHVISVAPNGVSEEFVRVTVEPGENRLLRFLFDGERQASRNGPEGATPEPSAPEAAPPKRATPEPTAPEPTAPEPTAPEPTAPEPGTTEPTAPEPVGPETLSGSMVVQLPEGVYEGDIRSGVPHGQGEMEWTEGARYYGEWRRGERHGVGYMEWSDGDYYEGEWREDTPEGSGLSIWNDGSRYEGDWSDGEPEGFGIYTEPDGLRYEGSFQEGRAVGGVLTVPSGEKYWATMSEEGEWEWEYPIEEDSQ